MADPVTKLELENASVDAGDLGDILNSDSSTTVTTRLGLPVKSVANAVAGISSYDDKGAWVTSTAYIIKDLVQSGGITYICTVAHTSGTFATDKAAGKWGIFQTEQWRQMTLEKPELFDNFLRADGALGNAESGQAYTLVGPAFEIASNELIAGGDLDTIGVSFLYAQLADNTYRISTEYEYATIGATDAVLAFVMAADYNPGVAGLFHPVIYKGSVAIQTRQPSGSLVTLETFTFDECVVGPKYQFDMWVNVDTNTVIMRLPDGQIVSVTDSSINSTIVGQWGYWEVIRDVATDDKVKITGIALTARDKANGQTVGPKTGDGPQALVKLRQEIEPQLIDFDEVTFTPVVTGWHRMWTVTGLKKFAGEFDISVPSAESDNITDIRLSVGVGAFASQDSIVVNQLHNVTFNQAVTKARVGNNSSNTLYFDLYVDQTGVPITVRQYGPGIPVNEASRMSAQTPAAGASAPSRQKTLVLGSGMRTAGDLVGQVVEVSERTIVAAGAATFDNKYGLTIFDCTAGNQSMSISPALAGKKYTFFRGDNSANTVTITAWYADGSTSRSLAYGESLTVIGTSFVGGGGQPVWAVVSGPQS